MKTVFEYTYKNLNNEIVEDFNVKFDEDNDEYIYNKEEYVEIRNDTYKFSGVSRVHAPFNVYNHTVGFVYFYTNSKHLNGPEQENIIVNKGYNINYIFDKCITPCLYAAIHDHKLGKHKIMINDDICNNYYKFYLFKQDGIDLSDEEEYYKSPTYCIISHKSIDDIFVYKFAISRLSDLYCIIHNIFTNKDFYNNKQFIQHEDYIRYISSCEYKIKYLSDEIRRLNNVIENYGYLDRYKDEYSQLFTQQTNQYEKYIKHIHKEFNKQIEFINHQHSRDIHDLEQKLEHEKDSYIDKIVSLEEINETNKELYKTKLGSLQQIIKAGKEKISLLEEYNNNLISENKELKHNYSTCESTNNKLRDECAKHIKTINNLNEKIETIEKDYIQRLTTLRTVKDRDISKKDIEIKHLTDEIKRLNIQLYDIDTSILKSDETKCLNIKSDDTDTNTDTSILRSDETKCSNVRSDNIDIDIDTDIDTGTDTGTNTGTDTGTDTGTIILKNGEHVNEILSHPKNSKIRIYYS